MSITAFYDPLLTTYFDPPGWVILSRNLIGVQPQTSGLPQRTSLNTWDMGYTLAGNERGDERAFRLKSHCGRSHGKKQLITALQ